jgi:molecular chaperone HscB
MAKPETRNDEKPSAGLRLSCWECQAELDGTESAGAHFCDHCGKVQPLVLSRDYFSFFGLPRKLGLDLTRLEQQFQQLSWKLHPDGFHNASPYERELSLARSAVLNDAFRTLRDPISRAEYLLRLEGVRREGEVKQQAPPDLLEEVFELNEELEELRAAKHAGKSGAELVALRQRLAETREMLRAKLHQLDRALEATFALWDEGGGRAALDRVSAILNRHSYLRNLVRNVSEELEEP